MKTETRQKTLLAMRDDNATMAIGGRGWRDGGGDPRWTTAIVEGGMTDNNSGSLKSQQRISLWGRRGIVLQS